MGVKQCINMTNFFLFLWYVKQRSLVSSGKLSRVNTKLLSSKLCHLNQTVQAKPCHLVMSAPP